tara:strand:+ start:617 stop:769 length:153 start_codon:yes stop_codon:yes gene_type:complete
VDSVNLLPGVCVDALDAGGGRTFVGVGGFNIAKYKWMRRPELVCGEPWRL